MNKSTLGIRSVATFCLFLLLVTFSSHANATDKTIKSSSFSQRKDVQTFINDMVRKHQFKRQELITLFNQVKIQTTILGSAAKPYEKTKPWYRYQESFLTPARTKAGLVFWQTHEKSLAQAEKQYGVPANIIVAIVGIETFYGQRQGAYRVIDALSTLAFNYRRRAPYFKKELEHFLLLSREQGIKPTTVLGSYTGAIGQPQFMPSSHRAYAVSQSGSKKIDLRNNHKDVIDSVANYFKKNGWQTGRPIAIPTIVPKSFFQTANEISSHKKPVTSLQQLQEYGLKHNLKFPAKTPIGIIRLQALNDPEYWIGFKNFYVIKRYNSSDHYAMAVYQLAEYLKNSRQQRLRS